MNFKQLESICKENETNNDLEELYTEYLEAKKVKTNFIYTLKKEIKEFSSKNKNILYEIMQESKNLLLYLSIHVKY